MKRDSFLTWMAAAASFPGRTERYRPPPPPEALEQDVTNVKAFGARGDGANDDTQPIQRAIDASGAGKPVLFPVGRYRVRQPIQLHTDTVLLGYGRHSILWCTEPGCDVLVCRKVHPVFLEGIALDGDATNRDGIVLDSASDVRVRRCWIKSMGRRGITVGDTPCAIVDSTVEMCGEDGIFVTETNSGDPAHVVACYIFANGGNGLRFTRNGNQAMIMGCEIVNNAGCGIRIDTASNMISIVGNAIMGSGADGVEISENSCYTGVVSNAISGNKRSGVSIRANANGTSLTANRFVDNCRGGAADVAELVVWESAETVVLGNVFARTAVPAAQAAAIRTDRALGTSAVANVFHGLATPTSL